MDADYIASPLSRQDICGAANRLRNALGFSSRKALPIIPVFEFGLPQLFDGFDYEIVDDCELPGREAETYPHECKIVLSQSTYLGALAGNPHARFTIGHEIGHLLLHTPQTLSLAHSVNDGGQPKVYEKPGWQADAFSAEFLAPVHMLQGMSVEEIVRQFMVSRQVAERQFDYAARSSWFGHCRQNGQSWLPGMEPQGKCWRTSFALAGGCVMK